MDISASLSQDIKLQKNTITKFMKRIMQFFFALIGACLLSGCATNCGKWDVSRYATERLGLANFKVSEKPMEIEGADGYIDEVWTLRTDEGDEFHIINDFYFRTEWVENSFRDDFAAVILSKAAGNVELNSLSNVVKTREDGTIDSYLFGQYSSIEELKGLFDDLDTLLSNETILRYKIDIPYRFEHQNPLRYNLFQNRETAHPLQDNSEARERVKNLPNNSNARERVKNLPDNSDVQENIQYLLDDADVRGTVQYDNVSKCYIYDYDKCVSNFILVCSDYRFTDQLNKISKDRIEEAISNSGRQIKICRDGEKYEPYPDLCQNIFGYGISFGTLYEIAYREGLKVSGTPFEFSFISPDGSKYEISYSYLATLPRGGGQTKEEEYGYYYIKDDEKIAMDACFYNHFRVDEVCEMTGLMLK